MDAEVTLGPDTARSEARSMLALVRGGETIEEVRALIEFAPAHQAIIKKYHPAILPHELSRAIAFRQRVLKAFDALSGQTPKESVPLKRCNRCSEQKPVCEFYFDSAGRLMSNCRTCICAENSARRKRRNRNAQIRIRSRVVREPDRSGYDHRKRLTAEQRIRMGGMLRDGVDCTTLSQRFGVSTNYVRTLRRKTMSVETNAG